jgi:hydroxymethylpyrimidine pyrophosphatase-like HAD family hydrolase
VFHKDVSKSKSVEWLSRRLGIKKKDVISVGNDYNDEDLLSWSGQAYVVNNAPDSLKKKFKTTLSNNHSGVTHAVEASGLLAR